MPVVPGLSFAAMEGERLLGTIQAWPAAILAAEGADPITLVGPVAVLPEAQGKGMGQALMARLLAVALEPSPPHTRGAGEALARWLLYVRSHWLRMPPHLLVPHLVRKAWMRRFPPSAEAPPAAHG